MPQKQNPAASVLIRSAALRAPQLGATLHLAAALAVDERPDGAWHAEWPTLRDLAAASRWVRRPTPPPSSAACASTTTPSRETSR